MEPPVRSSGEKVFAEASGLLTNKELSKAILDILLVRLSGDELHDFIQTLNQEVVVRDLDNHKPRYSFMLKPAQKPNPCHRTFYLKWEKLSKDLYLGMHYFFEKGYYYVYRSSSKTRQIVYSAGGLTCFKLDGNPIKKAELTEGDLNQIVEKITGEGGKDTNISFHLKQIYPKSEKPEPELLVYQYPFEFTQQFGWNRCDISLIPDDKLEDTLSRIQGANTESNKQQNPRTSPNKTTRR